jgi:hypothetical protein
MLTIDEEIAECDRLFTELAEVKAAFMKQKEEKEQEKKQFQVYAFMARREDSDYLTLALEEPDNEPVRNLPKGWLGRGAFNHVEIQQIIVGLKRLIGDHVDGD